MPSRVLVIWNTRTRDNKITRIRKRDITRTSHNRARIRQKTRQYDTVVISGFSSRALV